MMVERTNETQIPRVNVYACRIIVSHLTSRASMNEERHSQSSNNEMGPLLSLSTALRSQ